MQLEFTTSNGTRSAVLSTAGGTTVQQPSPALMHESAAAATTTAAAAGGAVPSCTGSVPIHASDKPQDLRELTGVLKDLDLAAMMGGPRFKQLLHDCIETVEGMMQQAHQTSSWVPPQEQAMKAYQASVSSTDRANIQQHDVVEELHSQQSACADDERRADDHVQSSTGQHFQAQQADAPLQKRPRLTDDGLTTVAPSLAAYLSGHGTAVPVSHAPSLELFMSQYVMAAGGRCW